jgi:hypothetical protein
LNTGTFKLAAQKGGVGHYAEVTVHWEETEEETKVQSSGHEFDWEKVLYPNSWAKPDVGFQNAALRGAKYALSHTEQDLAQRKMLIVIDEIKFMYVDTFDDEVAYAACFATWKALGDAGSARPYFEGRIIVWPDLINE